MRRAVAVVAALLLVFAVAGPAGAAPQPPAGPMGPPTIGLVTEGPVLDDNGFNESIWMGVQAGAAAIGGNAIVAVTHNPSDEMYARNVKRLVNRGADVIVTVGFLMASATVASAAEYPSVQFIGVDQAIEDSWPDNYQGLVFASAQSGYLAGIVAAYTTGADTVGTVGVDVGGFIVPEVLAFMNGYRNGVASVDPDIDVLTGYATSFGDPAEGYAVASGLIGDGADVVFGVAGGTTAGVLAAACDLGVWGIGVDVDQWQTLPDQQSCIVTSALKRVDTATSGAIERWWNGGTPELQSGLSWNDAANGGTGIAPIRNITPSAELTAELATTYAGFASGTIDPCSPISCDTP
jgi:basic membrane protein A and related proteins